MNDRQFDIKSDKPTPANQILIMKTLAGKMSIGVTDEVAKSIFAKYPNMVGRDIRNLLNLLKKFHHKEGREFTMKASMLNDVEEFIPFINNQ